MQRARQTGRDMRQHRLDLLDDGQGGRAAGFFDGEERGAFAVAAHDVGLRCVAITYVGDVAHIHHAAGHCLDRQVVERGHRVGAAVHLHVVFLRADFGCAAWQNQVLCVDGVDYVEWGKAFGLERAWIDIDHDLPHFSAERQWHGCALHRRELRADLAVAEVVELLLGQRVAGESELQDRDR